MSLELHHCPGGLAIDILVFYLLIRSLHDQGHVLWYHFDIIQNNTKNEITNSSAYCFGFTLLISDELRHFKFVFYTGFVGSSGETLSDLRVNKHYVVEIVEKLVNFQENYLAFFYWSNKPNSSHYLHFVLFCFVFDT